MLQLFRSQLEPGLVILDRRAGYELLAAVENVDAQRQFLAGLTFKAHLEGYGLVLFVHILHG